jgi:predicted methyltransferase
LVQGDDDLANLEIAGIQMKSATPSIKSVLGASIKDLRPLRGVCLDTCCGLGYSALAMAASPAVSSVVCCEVDANVLEAVRHNPASAALFDNPKIDLRLADAIDVVGELPDASFDRIFHDPPRLALAGELYSLAFYQELFRVLRKGGKLFHYTGAPGEKAGRRVREGIIRRLREAGFTALKDNFVAQGIGAAKEG